MIPHVMQQVDVGCIIPLRHRILRAGLPLQSAHFPGDADPSTWHFAVFLELNPKDKIEPVRGVSRSPSSPPRSSRGRGPRRGATKKSEPPLPDLLLHRMEEREKSGILKQPCEPVACASFMLNLWLEEPAWQLRGMAITGELQNRGIGKSLLSYAEETIATSTGTRLFWCNAREPAVPFYLKQSWRVESEIFDIPTAGPHRKMAKRLAPAGIS